MPILSVGVRQVARAKLLFPLYHHHLHQAGTLIDNELNVRPGTPLNMEVYLDSESSSVYGLMVTGMEVTDTKTQNEPILVNG